jgi:hypothetical protein
MRIVVCLRAVARLRAALVLIPALLLTACITPGSERPGAGEWRFVKRNDPVLGTTTAVRLYISRYDFNSETIVYTELELMCFKQQPVVRIHFPYKIGSNRSATLSYRFDERPVRESEARFLQDFSTIVLEDTDEVAEFIRNLGTAQTLSLSVSSLVVGQTWARFKVQGAPQAIEAAYAECPANDRKKQVASKRSPD